MSGKKVDNFGEVREHLSAAVEKMPEGEDKDSVQHELNKKVLKTDHVREVALGAIVTMQADNDLAHVGKEKVSENNEAAINSLKEALEEIGLVAERKAAKDAVASFNKERKSKSPRSEITSAKDRPDATQKGDGASLGR